MTETLAKRLVSMVLIAAGISSARITAATGLCRRSICTLKKNMDGGNIDDIFVVGHGSGRTGKVKGFKDAIVEELEKNNYHTRRQIADMILEKFGISLSVSAVGKFLKKNGIRRLKSDSIPAKANAPAQREFYNTTLHPLMLEAVKDKITLLFLDASHFVMGCDFLRLHIR